MNEKLMKKIREIAAGLLGAIFADSSPDMATQKSRVDNVIDLRSKALGQGGTAAQPQAAGDAELALSELQAMNRAAEIPSLNKAAASLAGVTVLLTGLFTGIGFSTGDFIRMIRDFQGEGIAFLILASMALLLGTFAFVINAYRSLLNLWLERVAVYFGIACAAAAFILAAWGISQGASAGPTRPTISASFDMTSNTPVLKVSVSSSDVPRSEHLMTTAWGKKGDGWVVLGNLITGPTHDGADNVNITVNNVMPYSTIVINAFLSSKDVPLASTPPNQCPTGTSCFEMLGLNTSSQSLTTTPSKQPVEYETGTYHVSSVGRATCLRHRARQTRPKSQSARDPLYAI
jgi:hypothetical protein